MNEKEQLDMIKHIDVCTRVITEINEHFKKTNWLCLKDYVEIIEKSKNEYNKTYPKKTKG